MDYPGVTNLILGRNLLPLAKGPKSTSTTPKDRFIPERSIMDRRVGTIARQLSESSIEKPAVDSRAHAHYRAALKATAPFSSKSMLGLTSSSSPLPELPKETTRNWTWKKGVIKSFEIENYPNDFYRTLAAVGHENIGFTVARDNAVIAAIDGISYTIFTFPRAISSIAWNDTIPGDFVASFGCSQQFYVDVEDISAQASKFWTTLPHPVWALAAHEHNLAIGDRQGAHLLDLRARSPRHLMHEARVIALKFSPKGQYLASGDDEGKLRLWDVRKTSDPLIKNTYAAGFKAIAFRPNNLEDHFMIGTGVADHCLREFSIKLGQETVFDSNAGQVSGLIWTEDDCITATSCMEKTISSYDAKSGKCLERRSTFSSRPLTLVAKQKGKTAFAVSPDQRVQELHLPQLRNKAKMPWKEKKNRNTTYDFLR